MSELMYYEILRSEFRKEGSKLRLYFMNIRREKSSEIYTIHKN